MPLSTLQVKTLDDAVRGYSFPTAHYDFSAQVPVPDLSIPQLETRIQQQLLSASMTDVKDGLSNVLYWGFTQMGGLSLVRADRFRSAVTTQQLQQASALFMSDQRPSLYKIAGLKLPQFSKISFVRKIRMYLDPVESATLDMQIMKINNICGDTILSSFKVNATTIPITMANSRAYEGWCKHLAQIARIYFPSARVVDIERGLFQMIQAGKVAEAAAILRNA